MQTTHKFNGVTVTREKIGPKSQDVWSFLDATGKRHIRDIKILGVKGALDWIYADIDSYRSKGWV